MFKSYQFMEIEKITSRDNRRLVNARKVRDGRVPEQIFIEGRRLVAEALASDINIDECFVTESLLGSEMLATIGERRVPIAELPDRIFVSMADTMQPQGIILIAKRPDPSLELIEERLRSSRVPIVVLLKAINNPANLGAVLRTAEAAGIAGVVVSDGSADAYSPKSLRGSMGA